MAGIKQIRRAAITVLFLFILIFTFIPFKQALIFEFQNSGRVLAYLPIAKGESFHMKYTHSIHLSDVIESFSVTKEHQIKLVAMTYEDFSIGMPENAMDGEMFEHKNGKYYISNMNRIYSFIDLRIGKVRANHILLYSDREYPLANYMEPGTWVRIKIERINLWQQWKGVKIDE